MTSLSFNAYAMFKSLFGIGKWIWEFRIVIWNLDLGFENGSIEIDISEDSGDILKAFTSRKR